MLLTKLIQLLCFGALINARDEKEPKISKKELQNPVSNLFYFEDSDVVLIHDREAGAVLRSDDAGVTWDTVDGVKKGAAWDLRQHPYDHDVAYILGGETTHWLTTDQGKSWKEFETPSPPSLFRTHPLSWHADDSNKVLFHGQRCRSILSCQEITYYTTNGFKDTPKELRKNTKGCTFARSTPLFEAKNDETIMCVVTGRYSPWPKDQRLVVSNDYFKTEEEPNLHGQRTVQGIINIAPVKGFIVAAAKAEGTRELAMYVTKDAFTWHRAMFPSDHKVEEDAYTVLESTNYSIQVDVMTTVSRDPMSVLFTSNSNGTYFTRNIEHMNRNSHGVVDFEKIEGIQGIVLVNVVDNWKQVEEQRKDKKIQSKISFDDGRTFDALKAGEKELHLHSVTDMSNIGRVFSGPAPGIVLGIGNVGDYLKSYEDGDLWVSDDAGVTWSHALEGAHKYEVGDQGSVLVAIYDEGPTDEIRYSLDHGKKWHKAHLGLKVRAKVLTTVPDSTSLKFVLLATSGRGSESKNLVLSIDFNSLDRRKCEEDDFVEWYARMDEKGKPDCLMGHKQYFNRRKADRDCFVKKKFKEELPQSERCSCTKEDYECDYNYKLVEEEKARKCIPAGVLPAPEDVCKNDEESYKGSSGFRLIPGNDCDSKDGVKLDGDVERPCKDTKKVPATGEISHEITDFEAKSFRESYYFERPETSQGTDETIIMRTNEQEIHRTEDHGKTWDQILEKEDIAAIIQNRYFNDNAFFLTGGKKVFYTRDRGVTTHHFTTEAEPTHDRLNALSFHPDYPDWFIWTGAVECGKRGEGCHNEAHYTTDRGTHWEVLRRYVRKCEYIKKEGRGESKKLIYCEQYKDENVDKPLTLVSSDNWFADSEIKYPNIVEFATMSEFIIVAAKDKKDDKSLKVGASVDGKTFADAEWPPNFNVPVQKAYTVLDSSTHAVFLHVTVGNRENFEYGSLVKSNSNGTSYVLSLDGVNRNTPGYVDFEKMLGIEGVALVNVVGNLEAIENGQTKKLKTLITHNDGAEWAPLRAPEEDSEGKKYDCDVGNPETCSIHLHGYTERRDPRDTFSSPTAIGIMMGVGNVGEYLGKRVDEKTIATFITRDGGITWDEVRKGNFMWGYGDQGSIIVIVQDSVATDVVFYTLDEGVTWDSYKFTDSPMEIESITTVPSDNSRNFLLWGRVAGRAGKISTVNLDFSGLKERSEQCTFNAQNPEDPGDDYHLWSPKHPLSKDENCLFGHVAQYVRKNPDAKCYNGRKLPKLDKVMKNCTCTRQDFECDYNYERVNDGSCKLAEGANEPDHSLECKKNPKQTHYFSPTGYRRIPLSTCEGGRELETYAATTKPCPGHEKEWEEEEAARGLHGFWFLVLAVLLPFALAGGVGYYVYTHWSDMKVGSIRLGAPSSSPSAGGTDWIKYPVAALAGTVAVVAAMPLLVKSLWRSVSGLWGGAGASRGRYQGLGEDRAYTTRGSFARGRGVVDMDEDELLGEDEDEE